VARKPRRKPKSGGDPARLGLKNYQHPDKFGEWLGYRIIQADRVKHVARAELEVRDDHLSPAARVHGGVVSAFLDFACGAAVFTTLGPDDFASTVELKVNYLRPLNVGDRLTAETRVVFRGKRLCVIHGFAYKEGAAASKSKRTPGVDGARTREPAAMVTATFNVVSREKR